MQPSPSHPVWLGSISMRLIQLQSLAWGRSRVRGSLWSSGRHVLSLSHIRPVEDGSSDLRGYPGKLLELQAGRKASFKVHNR